MRRSASIATLALLGGSLAACMTVPPEEDPVYLKQMEIDNRLVKVERLLDNQGLLNLQSQLAQQQKDNQALRNEVETLRHDLDQLAERQRQQYVDLDQRLAGGASRQGATAGGEGAAAAAGVVAGATAGADRASYQAAFDLLKQGHYEQATAAFRDFLARYPGSGLSDNAQYWLGESYYVGQKFKEALPEFELVISKYPESRKLPDALLKVGFCNYELKRWDASRKALSGVVQKFSGTTAAKLASERLQVLAGEGH